MYKYKLPVSDKELKEAFQGRRQAFVEEQDIPENIESDGYDGEAPHVIVKYDEKVIGTARVLFPTPSISKKDRIAILKSYHRTGIGSIIVSFLNEGLGRKQIDKLMVHAQYPVVAFHKSCGFTEPGIPFCEAGISHLRMEIKL